MQASQGGRSGASTAWLFDLLFSGTPTVTWAAAGTLPDGFECVDRFVVFPARVGRSFMVSLASRRGASGALTSYNSLRSGRTRLARRVLGLGLRTGVARPLTRDKIDIGIAERATDAHLSDKFLGEHLRLLFGVDQVVMAIGGGSGPYRKPVLQIFDTNGTPLGYIKVGWNDWTRAAVSREAVALRACAAHPMDLGVPEFLGLSVWRGLDLLITGPLPRRSKHISSRSGLPPASVLHEISGLAPGFAGELEASPWWLSVRSRIEADGFEPAARTALTLAVEQIEQAYGRVALTLGAWHGDLVPWNLARCGARLYAWDWECSTQNAPLGFDAVHYCFQVAFVAEQCRLAKAVALAVDGAAGTLRALGVPQHLHRLITVLHLLELAIRHEEARSSTGDIDERFYPAVMDVLQRALAEPGGLTNPWSARGAA